MGSATCPIEAVLSCGLSSLIWIPIKNKSVPFAKGAIVYEINEKLLTERNEHAVGDAFGKVVDANNGRMVSVKWLDNGVVEDMKKKNIANCDFRPIRAELTRKQPRRPRSYSRVPFGTIFCQFVSLTKKGCAKVLLYGHNCPINESAQAAKKTPAASDKRALSYHTHTHAHTNSSHVNILFLPV